MQMPNIAPLYGRGFPLKKNSKRGPLAVTNETRFRVRRNVIDGVFLQRRKTQEIRRKFFFIFIFLCGEFKRQQGESNFGKERKKIYKGGCSVPRPRVHRKGGPCALLTCTERALVFCFVFVFNLTNSGVATFCCHRRCFD